MAQAILKRSMTPILVAPVTEGNRAIITGSGSWIVPANVYTINVFCVGGGGGGMSYGSGHASETGWSAYGHGGGGGAGGKTSVGTLSVSPG